MKPTREEFIAEVHKQMEVREEALELVNKARQALGLPELDELPEGKIGDCHECPIARSLPVRAIDGRWALFYDAQIAEQVAKAWGTPWHNLVTKAVVRLPDTLAEFVARFDQAEYLDLTE